MHDRSDIIAVAKQRGEIIERLIRTRNAWKRWEHARVRPPMVLDDYFTALADAGDFNRRHPEIAIPNSAGKTA